MNNPEMVDARERDLNIVKQRLAEASQALELAVTDFLKVTAPISRPTVQPPGTGEKAIKAPDEHCAYARDLMKDVETIDRAIMDLRDGVARLEI